jgi:hypothetical protein
MTTAEDAAPVVAACLGVQPQCFLGSGDDAEVWQLEDGRIMKLTSSVEDAAACLAIMEAAAHGMRMHPGIAPVQRVVRLDSPLEVGAFSGERPMYAIVRSDVSPDDLRDLGEPWEDLMTGLNIASQSGMEEGGPTPRGFPDDIMQELDRAALQYGMAKPFRSLVSTLLWLRDELGIHVTDIDGFNFGRVGHSGIGPLDFGHALLRTGLAERMASDPALCLDMPEMDANPSRSPS